MGSPSCSSTKPSLSATDVQVITGSLKEYDWGVVDGLARWCSPTAGPQAELWFGTHPSGPALTESGERLDRLTEHSGMPLVKLLAASTPLSLQVHPDAVHAQQGWEADQQREPHDRRYADAAEKREMLVALTPFDVHAGWRQPAAAAEVLQRAGAPAAIVEAAQRGAHIEAIRMILHLAPAECSRIEPRLVGAATASGWSSEAVSALARVAATHPADPGVLVTVLLDHRRLEPGQALVVPAGVIHSYVDGLGVEVMTSSDNVLRMGLTSKPIAVDDALGALRPDHEPVIVPGFPGEVLAPPNMPFDLVLVDRPVTAAPGRHRLVLSLHGQTDVEVGGQRQRVAEGSAAAIAPGEPEVSVVPHGTAIVVSGEAP